MALKVMKAASYCKLSGLVRQTALGMAAASGSIRPSLKAGTYVISRIQRFKLNAEVRDL